MKKYPTPIDEGHFWGKLIHPTRIESDDDAESLKSVNWEVMQVYHNGGSDPSEVLRVFVPGMSKSQLIEDFVWGPKVPDFKPA